MTGIPVQATGSTAPRARARSEPRPARTAVEAARLRVVGRGPGQERVLRIAVEVHFDDPQSRWLRAEAERRSVTYAELIRRLVDAARSGSGQTAPSGQAEQD